jgi:hypothetical protein
MLVEILRGMVADLAVGWEVIADAIRVQLTAARAAIVLRLLRHRVTIGENVHSTSPA